MKEPGKTRKNVSRLGKTHEDPRHYWASDLMQGKRMKIRAMPGLVI